MHRDDVERCKIDIDKMMPQLLVSLELFQEREPGFLVNDTLVCIAWSAR